jgi:H+-transporting ATPase
MKQQYNGAIANGSGGQYHEKHDYVNEDTMSRQDFDDEYEEEDEDIDALIDELESQDGDNADYEEEEIDQPGGARLIPEDLLQTDTRLGLNSAEVLSRRKKFGYNQMKGM